MDGYWTVSYGPSIRTITCRECRDSIFKGENMVARDGRKIRLFYHEKCFTGNADPRTQPNSSFHDTRWPSNCFQENAPVKKGHGKWSVLSYGYNPRLDQIKTAPFKPEKTIDFTNSNPIKWGFARSETENVAFIRKFIESKNLKRTSTATSFF